MEGNVMDDEKVAEALTNLFGTGYRIQILSLAVRELGLARLAKMSGSSTSGIRMALERGGVGDKLMRRVFLGLLRHKPHVLRFILEAVINRWDKEFKDSYDYIISREKELLESPVRRRPSPERE